MSGLNSFLQDLKLIQEYEVPHFDRADIMRRHGKKYARLFMVVLARLKKTEDLRYAVTLVHDTLEEGWYLSVNFS